MFERIFRSHRVSRGEQAASAGEPPACAHLMLRPRWESGDYLCESCLQRFNAEEAEQFCSEAPLLVPREET